MIVDPRAASDRTGAAEVVAPRIVERDHGAATLTESRQALAGFAVETVRLDEVIEEPVGVARLDTEFHELEVLHGAEWALAEGLVRDLVLEDTEAVTGPVFECLRDHGYRIFGLARTFWGVDLVDPSSPRAFARSDATSYLATLEPKRAVRLMRPRGWHSLRGSAHSAAGS